MRRGEDLLIACPYCGKEHIQETLMSGNTRGARYWTDGKRDAPMLPTMPVLTRCDSCKTFFHVDDAEILVADAITECPDLVSELLKRGAEVNRQNNRGKTAYSKAKSCKYSQVMAILSDAGTDTTLGPEKEEEEDNSNGLKWI